MTPTRAPDLLLTAIAPIVWGSTYIVSTQLLPGFPPLAVAMLRALPAGLLLLAIVRQLPPAAWLGRVLILGALNFAVFWAMLFISAYRLPGGVAATVGAIQPLAVVFLSSMLLGTPLRARSVAAAKGRRIGRPTVVDPDKLAYAAHLRESGHTMAEIVAKTGITRTSLYRHLPPRSPEPVTAGPVTAAEPEPGPAD